MINLERKKRVPAMGLQQGVGKRKGGDGQGM